MGKGTLKNVKENLHKDITGFADELQTKFPDVVFTSGLRVGAKTKKGGVSRHSHGEALDFRIDTKIGDFLESDEGVQLLHKYQLGFLDESKAENKGWGNAMHVGKDSKLLEKTNRRAKEIVSTPNINYLDNNQQTTTFVPENEEVKEEVVDKDVEEVENKTKEYNFLDELKSFSSYAQEPIVENIPQQNQTIPSTNYLQQYEQISQFVDSPAVAQQGTIKKDEDQEWLKNWYSNRVIPNKDIQKEYLKIKPSYLENVNTLPTPQYVDSSEIGGAKGAYRGGKEAYLKIAKGVEPTVKVHEMTHGVTNTGGDTIYEGEAYDSIHYNLRPKVETPDWIKENYGYYTDPDEVTARLQVLRKQYNFKPDEEITPERVKDIRGKRQETDFNINQLLDMYNDEGLSKVLNTVAMQENPNNRTYAQQGGEYTKEELNFLSEIAIKDNNGYWNKSNQGKVVEIEGGKITMKNVNQKLIGISKDTGENKVMLPGKNYTFKNTKSVIEIPLFKK